MKVLLFSGGVESTCLAYWSAPDRLLTIDYGQLPASGEIRSAQLIASKLGIPHEMLSINANALGTGDLVGKNNKNKTLPTENWPFRNQFLITIAAMKYANDGLSEIQIGTVSTDSVHPDGSPEFIFAANRLLSQQIPGLVVSAPALHKTTLELVKESGVSRDLLGWTFSCHKASVACGHCRGCNKTLELFDALDATLTP